MDGKAPMTSRRFLTGSTLAVIGVVWCMIALAWAFGTTLYAPDPSDAMTWVCIGLCAGTAVGCGSTFCAIKYVGWSAARTMRRQAVAREGDYVKRGSEWQGPLRLFEVAGVDPALRSDDAETFEEDYAAAVAERFVDAVIRGDASGLVFRGADPVVARDVLAAAADLAKKCIPNP